MNRQQRRMQERAQAKAEKRIAAFRAVSPLAEDTYREAYNKGCRAALDFAMKTCYAGAVLAAHDLEGYGSTRNTRFLQVMDDYITLTLTSEEIIDMALEKAGVRINFREAFPEDRIEAIRP